MDHDITHCRGIDCPAKETCNRYISYLDAMKLKLEYISITIQNLEEIKKKGKCIIYWPTEKKYYGDDDSRPE